MELTNQTPTTAEERALQGKLGVGSALEILGLREMNSEKYIASLPKSDENLRRNAVVIQRFWENTRGHWNVGLRRKVRAIIIRKRIVATKIREILKYALFLLFFTSATIGDFTDQDVYHFQNNVRGQFAEVCLI